MRKEIARDLIPLVNNHDLYERLQAYVDAEIELIKGLAMIQKNIGDISALQGEYQALMKLKTLKARVDQDKA